MIENFIKELIKDLSFFNTSLLLVVILLLTTLDSIPPFIFIIPMSLVIALFVYFNAFNNDLLNLVFLILFPFFSLLGDIIYITYYSNNKFIHFIKEKLPLKKDKFNEINFYFFILTRFNNLFKLVYLKRFKNKLNNKVYIYLFFASFIQIFIITAFVYLVKIIEKAFKIKYLDYLLLIIFLLIFFHVFNIEEEKITDIKK